MEQIRAIGKLSRQSRNIIDNLEKFPDSLETYQRIWQNTDYLEFFYRQYGNFLDNLEIFQTFWKLSRKFGKLLENLEAF